MQTAGAKKRHAHFKEDSSVTACEACAKTFSAFRRRHHCRACGGIFCNACSTKRCEVAGQRDGLRRVCDDCFDQLNPSAVPAAAAQDGGDFMPVMPSKVLLPQSPGMLTPQSSAEVLGPMRERAPSWAHTLPAPRDDDGDDDGSPPRPEPPSAADEDAAPAEEAEEVIPPSPASMFSKAMFFYAVAETPVHSTFDLAHDESDEDHVVGQLQVGQVVEALRTKNDSFMDEDGKPHPLNVGVRVQLMNGWVTLKGVKGANLKRVRGTAEIRRMQAEFERKEAEADLGPSDSLDTSHESVQTASTVGDMAMDPDFDPMAPSLPAASRAPPAEVPPSPSRVSFAANTKPPEVERMTSFGGSPDPAEAPIEVIAVVKERGSERFSADVQWVGLCSRPLLNRSSLKRSWLRRNWSGGRAATGC